jgi:hypothetical protein
MCVICRLKFDGKSDNVPLRSQGIETLKTFSG